jgi:DNA-binding transcriptional LysR family regulator
MNTSTTYSWDLIRAFLAALDKGSLLGASRQLRTSQPTVGRQIAALEGQLGLVLFERTGRGLSPTAAALRLADSARAMESAAFELSREVAGSQGETLGSVRLSASQTIACYLLPPILATMRQHLPHIQIELVASNTVSNLLRREADIALRMVRPDQATLTAKRLGAIGLGIYASRRYLEQKPIPLSAADLLKHQLIGEDQLDNIIKGATNLGLPLTREHFVLRSDDLIVQWQAVRAGIGIGFISDYLAASDPEVVRVLPELDIPAMPLWLVVHREIHSSRNIRNVFDYLGEAIEQAINS